MNIKLKNFLWIVSLIIIGFIVLDIPRGLNPIYFNDSPAYMADNLRQGIVPIYPLFLVINKLIFGENIYLQIVIFEQIVFAILCSLLLVVWIKKRFQINYWETYIFYLLTFITYTVYLPEATSCRMIATEALAYPCFYLLIILVMNNVWTGKTKWLLAVFAMALFMALTRTQLQLILFIPSGAFLFTGIKKRIKQNRRISLTNILAMGGIAGLLFIFVYGLYQPSNLLLQNVFVKVNNIQKQEKMDSEFVGNANESDADNANKNVTGENVSSQYSTVVFAKVMFAALEEDERLFEDEDIRSAYKYVYGRLAEEKRILSAMDKNLYIGDNIHFSIADMNKAVYRFLDEFTTLYQEINIGNTMKQFETELLKEHPFRWILGCILQIPSGLISTVFFHKRGIYWLSYLATALIYGIAFATMIIHKKEFPHESEKREFLLTAIGINFLFVAVTSIAFIDMQRYVIYGFGVFYISLYLLLRQIGIRVFKNKCKWLKNMPESM